MAGINLNAKKQELLQRVTQAPVKPSLPRPPAAAPLPSKPISPNPDTLSPEEATLLDSVGWKPGESVPSDLGDMVAELRREREKFVPPVGLDTTAPVVKVKPLHELSEDEQAHIKEKMAQMRREAQMQAELANYPPSVAQAIQKAEAVVPPRPEPAKPTPVPVFHGTPAQQPPPSKPKVEEHKHDLGTALTHCPRCDFDLSEQDIPEPSYSEKIAFVQCNWGGKSYTKAYSLYGGNLSVTLRTLTVLELDAIRQQVSAEIYKNEIETPLAIEQRVHRYRLCLQLVKVSGLSGINHELPEGFTPKTNESAADHWTLPDEIPERETGLRAVDAYIFGKVLVNEYVATAVAKLVSEFNRFVVKLEANAANEDFWKETAA